MVQPQYALKPTLTILQTGAGKTLFYRHYTQLQGSRFQKSLYLYKHPLTQLMIYIVYIFQI